MLPAEEPTRNNPVTLPDSPSNRSASPKAFGKTGDTARPNPMAPNHNTNGDGAKISSENAISSEIERTVAISGKDVKRAISQIGARRATVTGPTTHGFD